MEIVFDWLVHKVIKSSSQSYVLYTTKSKKEKEKERDPQKS